MVLGVGPSSALPGVEYETEAPLAALRCAALRAVGAREALSHALFEQACMARRAGAWAQGMAAVTELRTLLLASKGGPGPVLAGAGADTAGAGAGLARTGSASVPAAAGTALTPMEAAWVEVMCRPDAAWRLEELRLMWRRGQHAVAARMAQSLASTMQAAATASGGGASAAAGQGLASAAKGSAPGQLQRAGSGGLLRAGSAGGAAAMPTAARPEPVQLAATLSLAGKWAACAQLSDAGEELAGSTSGAGSTTAAAGGTAGIMAQNPVLRMLSEAAQIIADTWQLHGTPAQGPSSGAVAAAGPVPVTAGAASGTAEASKVLYRLAQYADNLYREHVAVRSSPEYQIETQVIAVRVV